MLCTAQPLNVELWLRHATGHADLSVYDEDWPRQVLLDVARHTAVSIDEIEAGFQPLLAGDSAPLPERVGDLGAWCRGFLSGFGLGKTDLSEISDDSRGFLRDLERISQVDERVGEDEDEERALMEIVEYVRVGTLLLHKETHGGEVAASDDDVPSPTWH
jgi:hypothetical protein